MDALKRCSACSRLSIHDVCWYCVKARQRAVVNRGRCVCGNDRIEHKDIHRAGSRTWISCDRCLGTVKQLS